MSCSNTIEQHVSLAGDVQPGRLGLGDVDGLPPFVLIALAVPRHLCRLGALRAKYDPRVILGEGQMDVGHLEELASGHHSECHTKAVQLVS